MQISSTSSNWWKSQKRICTG